MESKDKRIRWQAKDYKCRNVQYSDLIQIEEKGEWHLAGAKRKYDDTIAMTKQQLQAERQKVKEFEAKVTKLEKRLAEMQMLLEETRQKNGHPLR